MPMTLLEAAKTGTGDVTRDTLIEQFARSGEVLGRLPLRDIGGNSYTYNLEDTLPGVGFRGVNEAYTESVGVVNPITERLRIAGGDLDVDKFIVDTEGAVIRAQRELMKIKALALSIERTMIKGDGLVTVREFDGFQARVTGNQLINAGATAGGDPLSIAVLDQLIDQVDDPTYLIMNKAMRRRLRQFSDTIIDKTIDEFGIQVERYAGLPLLVVDRDETQADIMAFDEAPSGGGASVSTSIYCASFGDGMVEGMQNGNIDARDLGELDTAPVFRTRVDWYVGLLVQHGRSLARVRGITNAAITA